MKNLGSKLLWCALILWFAWWVIDTFFYTKSDLQDARSEAYDAGYWQGMEDSSAFYKESDLELAYEEGYAEGKKDAKAEYKNSADSIDKVLRSAESFAVKEIGTGFLFEASRKDIQEYLEDTLPDQTGLSAYDKAAGDYNKTTNVKNSILRRMLMITYYCEYLSEYK